MGQKTYVNILKHELQKKKKKMNDNNSSSCYFFFSIHKKFEL